MPPDEKLVHDVVMLAGQKMSRRAIARALKIGRNTVREILGGHDTARVQPHSALPAPRVIARASKLDSFRPKVDELLKTYLDITAQRVFEILREMGFDGGYTGVKTLVRRIRPKSAPKPSLETPPRIPGDMAECDWSSYPVTFTNAPPVTLQAFGYTLRYSTRKYFGFHEGNGLHPLMDGHVQAFERFGGAARRCKYDVQKPAVLRWEGPQPIYNPRFIDFATYYEYSPVACHPRSPNEKPRVERSFWELTLSFFRGRSFRDLADLKAQLTHWMDTIADLRPLKRMKRRTRLELFAEEQPLLRPLPRHPYDTARVLYSVCDIEGFIAWESNWYSLPYEYVTDILPVRITANELFVYKADLTCIARHALKPRGAQEKSILDGHRPRLADRGPGLDQLRGAFTAIDEKAGAFLAALEKAQPHSAGYHARKVLALRGSWGTADWVAALEHALAYGALEHQSVEQILLVRGTPRRLDEYLAKDTAAKLDQSSTAGPRDLAEYDALPVQGFPTTRSSAMPKRSGERAETPEHRRGGSQDELREQLQRHLKRLGLAEFDIEAHLRWASEQKPSDLENIERLLATAAAFKLARSIESRFARCGLKEKKSLVSFDWDFQPKLDRRPVKTLFDLSFVARHEDILITGKAGTGKSHILKALVLKACECELTVRYARCVDLIDDLYAGLADGSYERRMRQWCRPQFLVVDDVGLGQLKRRGDEPTAAHMLFTLLDRRHMTASTGITSNLLLSGWGKYLGDATLAAAVLDRLAANSIRLDIDGPSYRQHLARKRAKEQGLEPPAAEEQA